MKILTCIVKGCPNKSNEGLFIGQLCGHCHSHLIEGKIGHTCSFLGELKRKADMCDTLLSVEEYRNEAFEFCKAQFGDSVPKAGDASNKKKIARYVEALLLEVDSDDKEMAHINADVLLCELLTELGYEEVAKTYDECVKWY